MKTPLIGKSNITWIQLATAFLLGALVFSNVFFLLSNQSLQQEIAKLKKDDLLLAQTINNILSQLKSTNLPK